MPRTIRHASVAPKIGAERSNLLGEAKLKTLAQAKDLADFASQLRGTAYQEGVNKVSPPFSGSKLERTFRENLIDTFIKIVKYSPRDISIFLKMYIQRFEVENLKTLIKAINAEMTTEQKISRVYFSAEDFLRNRPLFEDAVKAPDYKHLLTAMKKTQYASALENGLNGYEESGATTCFDVLIDKVFYEKFYNAYVELPRREKTHAYFYAETEDAAYILTALLRGKKLDFETDWLRVAIPDAHFLGNDTVEAFVTAADFNSALNLALKTPFGKFFAKAQTPEETVASAEIEFQRALYIHALGSRVSETFNVGLELAFMYQKNAEIHNLIAACLGVEIGLSSEEIQKNMLLSG